MTETLHRIVYISRATRVLSDDDLKKLADWSQRWNVEHGVTGLLLHDGSRFIQALEGSRDEVCSLIDRIAVDRRHASITYMNDGPVGERQFHHWSMKVHRVGESCAQGALDAVRRDLALVRDEHLRAAFIGFAALGRRSERIYTGGGSGAEAVQAQGASLA